MVKGEADGLSRRDWVLANPWLWAFLGLGLSLTALGLVTMLPDTLDNVRLILVFIGVLAVAAGLVIRLNSAQPSYLDEFAPVWRDGMILGLTAFFALIAGTITVFLVLRFFEIDLAGWRLGGFFLLWVVVCPMSVAAAVRCARRVGTLSGLPSRAISAAEEATALLAVAALTTFVCCWALYNPNSPEDWDSLRLFLGVLFVVTIGAAPLVLVSQAVRRLVVSLLIVLHFAGIGTAVVSAPPAPWLVQQVWGRIYQPYLEFMYLNNAYHFYAPEPGPASYLWFRMYYEDPQGKLWAHWIKVPDLDVKGWHKYPVALNYQRMLALTENVVPTDPTPSMYVTHVDGTTEYADWYGRRLEHIPPEQLSAPPVVGRPDAPVDGLKVPYPFYVPVQQQYQQPNANSLTLLSAYARHVCLEKHPEHPEWKVNSVKIYRVVHVIPEVGAFVNEEMDPRDPANYRPYYMGKYNPRGDLLDMRQVGANKKVINPGDPFLFWLLPNLREPPNHLLKSPIKCWALKHADDPDWIYTYDETEKRHLLEEERAVLNRPDK